MLNHYTINKQGNALINVNVLVTGSNGQLGNEIKDLVENMNVNNSNFYFTCRDQLDITNFDDVEKYIQKNNITTIVNCAAYTVVDKAESEEELADSINHKAVGNLALLAKKYDIKLIHVSTDYVFDGKNYKPYKIDDITNPQAVYGKTKLDGEKALLHVNPKNSFIIRTSWVYSSYGVNFVKTMLRLGKERKELGVVYDQIGTPTYARDLAKAILKIIQHSKFNIQNSTSSTEIYNFSNEGVASWYDFAKEIMCMAKLTCKVNPIETKDYPTPASRPHYSVLDKSEIKKDFDIDIPYWKDSLDECLKRLGERR